MRGRYLKAAEKACARKARFDTALDAERTCDWRFRAYRCPICGHFHLTSRPGLNATDPEEAKAPPPPPGPKLADLDWSAALDPKPKEPPKPPPRPYTPPKLPAPKRFARCAGPTGKDKRVPLVLEGRLVKSEPVRDEFLRTRLKPGLTVQVDVQGAAVHILAIES